MELSITHSGEFAELAVRGRLDAYWSNALASALDDLVRDGHHRIRLTMAEVAYMSSGGIRVLLKFHKQLQRINGALVVSQASEAVRSVLELAGLQVLLRAHEAPPSDAASGRSQQVERDGVGFEMYAGRSDARLTCRAIGAPERLRQSGFAHCQSVRFAAPAFGIGLGAFGSDFDDCQGRFGEFLAAGGAAACLPTDGRNVADYVVTAGALVPELRVLYALVCEGAMAHMLRFEHSPEAHAVALPQLVRAALDLAEVDIAGLVMVGESAGLIGAALRRSPVAGPSAGDFFRHPDVRERLSYSPEHAFPRSLALVVGIAARIAPPPPLAPFLRPLGPGGDLHGHFHAAAFSYHPLQKGAIELAPVARGLFEGEQLQGVMHLIGDDRPGAGVGQSEFVRGACWIGRIAEIATE